MSHVINVLDHGYVRLVDRMGDDLSIVRAARVSYNADWRTGEDEGKDEKLIRYLYRNKHTSPFEAVTFTFEVKAPIFVLRQWHRHRVWSYSEISARYCELDEGYYVPDPRLIGTQDIKNKQARVIDYAGNERARGEYMPEVWADRIEQQCQVAFKRYRNLLAGGCPRELARSVLPVAAYSRMFATVNLHNLFHFLRLRLHEHAQYEIRVYAEALLELIRPIVPHAVAAFEEQAP